LASVVRWVQQQQSSVALVGALAMVWVHLLVLVSAAWGLEVA
jgi:hypothetical protein